MTRDTTVENEIPLGRWSDELFWLMFRRLWAKWADVLVLVKPETVVSWHRTGFRLYWRFLSRRAGKGRPRIAPDLRQLLQRRESENPSRGAPRIQGELLKLGFEISERTVSRYLAQGFRKAEGPKGWPAFLPNPREVMAAMDFFTIPTATWRVLYGFCVMGHGRRRILPFNVTEHPTSPGIVQQLREAFLENACPESLILDRDGKFDGAVTEMIRSPGRQLIRTAYRSPGQKGVPERWVGSCRRDLAVSVSGFAVIRPGERRVLRPSAEFFAYRSRKYADGNLDDARSAWTPLTDRPWTRSKSPVQTDLAVAECESRD